VGLKPGQDQLVFDRFWRADPARARTTGGTGLGLAIALEDAQLHGGWLQAWGSPGRGSVFRLTIPRVAGQKLVGSPLPLVPDDTGLMPSIGEIVPGALGLGGDLPTLDQATLGQLVPDEADPDETDPDEADPGRADPERADPERADPDQAGRDRADLVGGTEVGTRG
jgi:two-component system sensor histidine kinase MtrB